MHDWEYPVGCSNPIYFTKTSDYASSSIDFYSTYESSGKLSTMGGWTDFYYYGVISPWDQNWLSAQITINQYLCPTTYAHAKGCIAHELGHAYGLYEANTDIYSIMCQTGSGRVVDRAGYDDNLGILYLYG